jgi:hypothetical protein
MFTSTSSRDLASISCHIVILVSELAVSKAVPVPSIHNPVLPLQ